MQKDSGGSAAGMSFRDAAALRAMEVAGPYLLNFLPEEAAKKCYEIADALVAEKRKSENV